MNKVTLWVIGGGLILVLVVFIGGYYVTRDSAKNSIITPASRIDQTVGQNSGPVTKVLAKHLNVNGCSEEPITFALKGNRVAYIRCSDSGEVTIVDGDIANSVKALSLIGRPHISSDGSRIAYVIDRQIEKGKVDPQGFSSGGKFHQYVIDNMTEGMGYDGINGLLFSQSGKSLAYAVNGGGGSFIVINSKEGKRYDHVSDPLFMFGAEQVIYLAKQGKNWFVVSDDKEEKSFNDPKTLTISANGKVVAYTANENGESFVVVNGKKDETTKEKGVIDELTLSRDGESFAYRVKEGEKVHYVFNGKAGENYDIVHFLTISQDGKRFAYIASSYVGSDGNKHASIIVDGKEIAKLDNVNLFKIIFSSNGKNIAYTYFTKRENKFYARVVVNGEDQKEYEGGIDLYSFTPDNKDVVYVAKESDKIMLVIGTKEYKKFDRIWTPSISQDGSTVSYGAKDGAKLLWVTEKI